METDSLSLSVIIPAHNAAEYLNFTLLNMIDHLFSGLDPTLYEVIVIDDGSTDDTHLLVQSWTERYPNFIRFLSTPNRGVSAARNSGLDMARGRYVYFMDSDDILLRGSLQALCSEADRCGVDVVKFVFRDIDSAHYEILTANVPDANLQPDDFHLMCTDDYVIATNGLTGPPSHHATWSTIYRRSFLSEHALRFNENLTVGEDIILIWQAMLCRPKVLYVDRALYLYHNREGSAMNAHDPESLMRQSNAYLRYLAELITISSRARTEFGESNIGPYLDNNLRYATNRALEAKVLAGAPLTDIYRAMNIIRTLGGDIHPGRPRFNKNIRHSVDFHTKLKRWITAYILASYQFILSPTSK